MADVPVLVVCYNRPAHLAQVLAGLERLDIPSLYVISDGPKDEDDRVWVGAVRGVVDAIGWTRPTVLTHPHNIGLATNVVHGVDWLLDQYDRVIVLEDDCIPGSHFYRFMVDCLDKYRTDPNVGAVSGYAYPLPAGIFDGYPYDAFFFPRIESWGWATWRDRWDWYVRDDELRVGLDEARRAVLHEHFTTTSRYEWMFWDMAWRMEGWPV